MHTKRSTWTRLIVHALAGLALALGAAKHAAASEPDYRWYVTPSVGAIFSGTGAGPQGTITVGRSLLPRFGLEAELGYGVQSLNDLPSGNDYQRLTLGLNALGYFTDQDRVVRPYALVSLFGHRVDFLGESLSGVGVGLGGGAFFNLSPRTDLRVEARYNLDFVDKTGIVPDSSFHTGSVLVGLRYKFGSDPDDSDGDGVLNSRDKCPNTPPGVAVYSDGCPMDMDGDGVPDYLDKCPDSPKGIAVDKEGCPLDSDGDGIPDYLDECPNTPKGLKVLPNGCALTGDCRRPKPGEAVDKNGCALDHRFILRGVKFEFDSDRLTEPSKLILNDVAETLKAYPTVFVDVEGHTDGIGIDTYNQVLSERRANAVKRYLADRGAKPNRLRPVGYGEAVPIDSNATEIGRDNNRRVEFKVTKE